jgi:hypothetical protein
LDDSEQWIEKYVEESGYGPNLRYYPRTDRNHKKLGKDN